MTIKVEDKIILEDVNIEIKKGETHVLFGPNGVGKSSLLMAIMGFPKYKIIKGKIYFKEKDITDMNIYERAKLGIGIALQKPPSIRGVTLKKIIDILNGKSKLKVDEYIDKLKMRDFLNRDLNYKFSGGEIKRAELLQLLVQNPSLSLIDEPESGVDVDNIKIVGEAIRHALEKDKHIWERESSGLIITHTGAILDYIKADFGHIMINKKVKCTANPRDIFDYIMKNGFKECGKCPKNMLN